jgi:hypothetical protein
MCETKYIKSEYLKEIIDKFDGSPVKGCAKCQTDRYLNYED